MKMPVVFVGHGSPMNAIENNQFTVEWEALGAKIPRPEAILAISAHWYTPGTRVTDTLSPRTVYDMYGFPEELYRVVYNAPGSPHFARLAQKLIGRETAVDNSWGIDHGTWSVLHRVYPKADIPVFQLSVDRDASPEEQYQIGQELSALREQGVLLFGSGNVVHNLSRIEWNASGGTPWAEEFDSYVKENVLKRDDEKLLHYEKAGPSARLAFVTLDHYAPLLYILGASESGEPITVFNDSCVLGSLSMTSYLLG